MGFFIFIGLSNYAQNQTLADSLEQSYKSGNLDEKDLLKILEILAQNHTIYEKRVEFIDELIEVSQDLDAKEYLWSGYLEKGNVLTKKGDLSLAMESYLKAADIAIENNNDQLLGATYTAIAGAYYNTHNHQNTVYYYQKAIKIFEKGKTLDSINFAKANMNLGDEYLRVNQPDSALIYLLRSEPIFNSLHHEAGMAYNLGNIGIAYFQKGKT